MTKQKEPSALEAMLARKDEIPGQLIRLMKDWDSDERLLGHARRRVTELEAALASYETTKNDLMAEMEQIKTELPELAKASAKSEQKQTKLSRIERLKQEILELEASLK